MVSKEASRARQEAARQPAQASQTARQGSGSQSSQPAQPASATAPARKAPEVAGVLKFLGGCGMAVAAILFFVLLGTISEMQSAGVGAGMMGAMGLVGAFAGPIGLLISSLLLYAVGEMLVLQTEQVSATQRLRDALGELSQVAAPRRESAQVETSQGEKARPEVGDNPRGPRQLGEVSVR